MLIGALALALAAPLPAPLPRAVPSAEPLHMWQPTIFSGKRGGWPTPPPTPAIDPASGMPNPVICRSGGASILTGRRGDKPVCTVEAPEVMNQSVTPTIFSGRLASRERTRIATEQTQYVETRQAYAKARAEAAGTGYVPPPPPVMRQKVRVNRPSIFTGRRTRPAGQ